MGERSRSLSVLLTPGFAPFEQYHRKGKQGPWSDIYGAAAVLYLLATGEPPPEANERMAGDELKPASAFGVSRPLSDALTAGLALNPEARPRTVVEFQALLAGANQNALIGSGGATPQTVVNDSASAPRAAPMPRQSSARPVATVIPQTPTLPFHTTNPLNPKGRFTRLSLLAWYVLIFFLAVIASALRMPAALLTVLLLVPAVIFNIRRLHDIGQSAWWSLCLAVPYANILFILALLAKAGDPSVNRFGPSRPTRSWERVLGFLGVILFVIVIVAAFFNA